MKDHGRDDENTVNDVLSVVVELAVEVDEVLYQAKDQGTGEGPLTVPRPPVSAQPPTTPLQCSATRTARQPSAAPMQGTGEPAPWPPLGAGDGEHS